MTEKSLEKKLKKEVEKLGGLCLKCVTPGFTGMMDRMCLLPGGNIWFVELKKGNGILSERQCYVIEQVQRLGFPVRIVWNDLHIEKVITEMNEFISYDL